MFLRPDITSTDRNTSLPLVWTARPLDAAGNDKRRLQHIIRSAEEVIGCNLPSLQDRFASKTLRRAEEGLIGAQGAGGNHDHVLRAIADSICTGINNSKQQQPTKRVIAFVEESHQKHLRSHREVCLLALVEGGDERCEPPGHKLGRNTC
ncbi:unnamed protein product [Pleuronectes platessa]|uniref:Uncharacterized protein n=1 Tax=Pleuronectes platessa TaxID=8262 RepID=A0A9N7VM34_PLEPL|nr:unnamed protein product [Pleuronectes platessa]